MAFLTPHLSPADLSPVLTTKKGNCETFPWRTSHFMSNDCLKLQETSFSRAILTIFCQKMVSTQQIRHLWVASDITISLVIMGLSDSQVRPLLSPTKFNSGIKRIWSAYISRAATPCALTGAIPLLLAASTLSCWMSPLARIALPQTTWPPRVPPE